MKATEQYFPAALFYAGVNKPGSFPIRNLLCICNFVMQPDGLTQFWYFLKNPLV